MTKKLDETLNLRSMDEIEELSITSEALNDIDAEIVSEDDELAIHIKEMNEVYACAMKAHRETIDLGYSVDTKHCGDILSTSGKFLEIAISASTSKIDKKLRQAKLDREIGLSKLKKEATETVVDGKEVEIIDGKAELLTRNDVMDKLEAILLKKPKKKV